MYLNTKLACLLYTGFLTLSEKLFPNSSLSNTIHKIYNNIYVKIFFQLHFGSKPTPEIVPSETGEVQRPVQEC